MEQARANSAQWMFGVGCWMLDVSSFLVALEKLLNRLPMLRQNDLRMRRAAARHRVVQRTVPGGNVIGSQFRCALAHTDELRVGKVRRWWQRVFLKFLVFL
jgi:hypothetical protein